MNVEVVAEDPEDRVPLPCRQKDVPDGCKTVASGTVGVNWSAYLVVVGFK